MKAATYGLPPDSPVHCYLVANYLSVGWPPAVNLSLVNWKGDPWVTPDSVSLTSAHPHRCLLQRQIHGHASSAW